MMFFLYCIVLVILCSIPLLIIQCKSNFLIQSSFKNHLIFFLCKSIIISMFIYIFISNLSISNNKLFILVGCVIFILFHFIEGYVLQKILLEDVKRTRNER